MSTAGGRPTHGLLWVAAGASLWGTDTVLRQPLTRQLTSFQIVLGEHLVLAAILIPWLWRSRMEWRALQAKQWAAILGIAWGSSALGTLCFTSAIAGGNPTTAVLLQKLQPLFAVLLARLVLGESLGKYFGVYLLAAICGGWLVSLGTQLPAGALADASWPAACLAVAAAALWGSSTVLSRLVLFKLSFTTLTALRIVVAVPLLAVLVLAKSGAAAMAGSLTWRVVPLALIPGLAGLLIYYRGLSATRASLAAVAELSFPAVAVLLNWAFLSATISIPQVAGFALLWAVILKLQQRHREVPHAESGHASSARLP